MDKYFNPHIFLRLVNLDPAYCTTSMTSSTPEAAVALGDNRTSCNGGGGVADGGIVTHIAGAQHPIHTLCGAGGSGAAAAPIDRPCRTSATVRGPSQVIVADASQNCKPLSSSPDPWLRNNGLEKYVAGSHRLTDPGMTAIGTAASAPELYACSKTQDVLEYGRLLGALFLEGALGNASQSNVIMSAGSTASGFQFAAAGFQPVGHLQPVSINNFTTVSAGAAQNLGTDGAMAASVSLFRKQSTYGSDQGGGGGILPVVNPPSPAVETSPITRESFSTEDPGSAHQHPSLLQQLLMRQQSPTVTLTGVASSHQNAYQQQQQHEQQKLLQRQRQQQDATMLAALDSLCPELGGLARACLHPVPSKRPSFSTVVATLESRVRPSLSGGLGLPTLGVSHMPLGRGGDLSAIELNTTIGGDDPHSSRGRELRTAEGGASSTCHDNGGAGRLDWAASLVAVRSRVATGRSSLNLQMGAAGQLPEKSAMRRCAGGVGPTR